MSKQRKEVPLYSLFPFLSVPYFHSFPSHDIAIVRQLSRDKRYGSQTEIKKSEKADGRLVIKRQRSDVLSENFFLCRLISLPLR